MTTPTCLSSSIADAYTQACRGLNKLTFSAEALECLSRSLEDERLAGLASILTDAHREAVDGLNSLRNILDKAAASERVARDLSAIVEGGN